MEPFYLAGTGPASQGQELSGVVLATRAGRTLVARIQVEVPLLVRMWRQVSQRALHQRWDQPGKADYKESCGCESVVI